jgi:peptide-methionine (S)-S-oxide reductase
MKPTIVTQEAIVAMGCFWSGSAAFMNHAANQKIPGVLAIRVGYTGGTSKNPTYPAHEGHQEAIKVVFDPSKITYAQVLDIFWHSIDPFDAKGQFCDKGPSYASAIYYTNEKQRRVAVGSKRTWEKEFGTSIVTEIKPAGPFYDAEDYHQDYKLKNPIRYNAYHSSCGRDQRLQQIWK